MHKLSSFWRFTLGAGLIAAAAFGLGVAQAGSPGQNETGPAVRASPPPPNAGKIRWIVVNPNGTKARSYGSLTSDHVSGSGGGRYEVFAPVNVTKCAYIGSLGKTGNLGSVPGGSLTVAGRNGHAKGVFVATFDASGTQTDEPFHLEIIC